MKKTAYALLALLALASCNALNTTPEDYYASGNYWKTTAQVEAFLPGLYNDLRDVVFNHTIRFGELGSGIYVTPTGTNGNSISDQPIILHNLSEDVPGVDSWGGYYKVISDCNLFIEKVTDAGFVPSDERNYLLAQAYGLRAFLYFDLYRIYGGVPLRLDAEVAAHGENDVNKLYLARSTASETMAQIIKDVDTSLELFGSQDGFDPYNLGARIYWNKAASECLAAEILLWNTKVSVGDYAAVTDGSLLSRAKSLLEDVAARPDVSLLDNFSDVFSASNKANAEVIFAVHYGNGEATNSNGNWLYHTSNGVIHTKFRKDGSAFGDPLSLSSGYNQTYEYVPAMYLQYEGTSRLAASDAPLDSRADATFLNVYDNGASGLELLGTMCCKNVGEVSSGIRVMSGDYIIYRLSWVYLTLAEIANYSGDGAAFEKYVNKVRIRAYGANWNDSRAVKHSSFSADELALLAEKDREFVQEGQRWWDLRRMQTARGDESTHLLFVPEGNPAGSGGPVLSDVSRVLWPIPTTITANDPTICR